MLGIFMGRDIPEVQPKVTNPEAVLEEWRNRDATVRVHARARRTVEAYRREQQALRR